MIDYIILILAGIGGYQVGKWLYDLFKFIMQGRYM